MSITLLRVEQYLDLARANGHTTYEKQAAAAGLGVATIHRLRNGEPAGQRSVAAICNAYGVEFADLFAFGTADNAPVKPKAQATA